MLRKTGDLLKEWRQRTNPSGMPVSTTALAEKPTTDEDIYNTETMKYPVVQSAPLVDVQRQNTPRTGPIKIPAYYKYTSEDKNILSMLYAATVECWKRFERVPYMLYIHQSRVVELACQYQGITGKSYFGYLQIAMHRYIEVFPHTNLPALLGLAAGHIEANTVIAVFE